MLYLHNIPLDSGKANIISILYLCDSFQKLGVDVILAVPESKNMKTDTDITIFLETFIGRSIGFKIVSYPKFTILGKFKILGSYFGAKKILQKSDADLCYVRIPLFLHLAARVNIPVVFESHNSLLHTKYNFLDKFWKKILIGYSKTNTLLKFVAISQALADFWSDNGIDEKKIIPLHDGFDFHSFAPSLTRKEARTYLGLEIDGKIVVYAGSLYPDRGIEHIIELAEIYTQAQFIVLGGPLVQKHNYEKIVKSKGLDNLNFIGRVPQSQVKNYLYAADVLLMIWSKTVPTIDYCSPLKMFEYMASGRIIVGHGFRTIREVLTDQISAYLADPESFEELSLKLQNALDDSYPSKIAETAKSLAFDKYSWEKRSAAILKSIQLGKDKYLEKV